MSKQSDNALSAMERIVFRSTTPVVVALTGGWGEGKTHFWREVIAPKHRDRSPGYISVFGAETLAVIRERVCLATFSEPKLTGFEKLKATGSIIARSLGQAADYWGGKIGAPESLAVELLQTYRLEPGWIVCIDDVERLSKQVGLETFFGYVAELRDRWKLKVVLIFNREHVTGHPVFTLYQEKVIDREIPFVPDFDEIVHLVYRDLRAGEFDVASAATTKMAALQLRNIRIALRARRYLEEVLQVLPELPSTELMAPVFSSLTLFTYVKLAPNRPAGLTFEMIQSHNALADRMRRSGSSEVDDETDRVRDTAKDLLDRYGYSFTDDLDRVLLEYVRTDVLDVERLQAVFHIYRTDRSVDLFRRAFREVWDVEYHGRLRDNSDQLADALEKALAPYLAHIPPNELDFTLVVLSALGRSDKAQQYFAEFQRIRGGTFEALDRDSMPIEAFEYPPLKEYFDEILANREADTRSVADVINEVVEAQFMRQRDEQRFLQFSLDDLVNYFVSQDQPKLTSRLRLLVKESRDEAIRVRMLEVVRRIGDMNALNRMRLQGMGLLSRQVRVPDDGDAPSHKYT